MGVNSDCEDKLLITPLDVPEVSCLIGMGDLISMPSKLRLTGSSSNDPDESSLSDSWQF